MVPAARVRWFATLALWSVAFAAPAGAVPDLASRRTTGAMMVFADDQRPDLFYYAPLEIRLVAAPDGKPDFSFVEMRYTGSALSRDRGLVLHRSFVTLRVQLPPHSADELARCARSLGVGGRAADLRPLPIRRLEAALIYSSIGTSPDTTARALPGGRFQGSREAEGPAGESYWTERVFTVGVDSLTAQALHATLENGQLSMSLGYAFVADGRLAREPWGAVDGPQALSEALGRELSGPSGTDLARRDSVLRRVVVAGAIPIRVDARRWPDLLRRVDVDADSRAGFAALEVYCYDFRDNRRPDLYEKQVEVEAESVGGQPVRLQVAFARAHPDVYSASLRFPVAVKLDRPYHYRVAELRPDGSSTQGNWRAGRDWVGLLDLTTPALPTVRGVRSIR
jgi:hypothetical protein